MSKPELKHRQRTIPAPVPDFGGGIREQGTVGTEDHPAGDIKHGGHIQLLRLALFASYFWACCFSICATQFLGSPLYFINRDMYYAYMALTKESFGLLITTMTQWWSPTVMRINGDESVRGQLRKLPDGRLECDFPERIVMIANHQLYSDWLYLWWIGYANKQPMHGHIYIILKESLKYVPIIGPGMMFFGFIFMSRKMEKDKPRLAHRLGQLKSRHSGPKSGPQSLDPMWLLIFPEGTNLSDNGRVKSAKWAEKIGVPDMQHQLLPRSTGTYFCLNELKGTVDWVYDCTLAYEGVPRGQFGQDIFTLRSTYFEGRPPKSVNMYWRRFAISSIPLDSPEEFDLWVRERWYEKDALMEEYIENGRFPSSDASEGKGEDGGFIETEVKPAHWWEFTRIFMVLAAFGMVANLCAKVYNAAFYGNTKGWTG